MVLQKKWIERLMELSPEECLPLEDTPKATIYSAVHYNKKELKKLGMKFRVQKDQESGKEFVCRVK